MQEDQNDLFESIIVSKGMMLLNRPYTSLDDLIMYIITDCEAEIHDAINSKRTELLDIACACNKTLYLYSQLLKNPGDYNASVLEESFERVLSFCAVKNKEQKVSHKRKKIRSKEKKLKNKPQKKIKLIKKDKKATDVKIKNPKFHFNCGCKRKLRGVYSTIFRHVSAYHEVDGRYRCFIDNCTKKYKRRARVIYHWKRHGIYNCCNRLWLSADFKIHRESCSKPLPKKRKFKKINKATR